MVTNVVNEAVAVVPSDCCTGPSDTVGVAVGISEWTNSSGDSLAVESDVAEIVTPTDGSVCCTVVEAAV